MAIYFFVGITFIIIALLGFALSESHGKNSRYARNKGAPLDRTIESSTPAHNSGELASVQTNHLVS